MEVRTRNEIHSRQRIDLGRAPARGDRPWTLIAVVIFLVATATLLTRHSSVSPQIFRDSPNRGFNEFEIFEDYESGLESDTDDVDLEVTDVQLLGEEAAVAAPAGAFETSISKVVVASASKGKEADLNWITEELPDWQAARYTYDSQDNLFESDGPESQTVTKNKGREANVYLTYIITHYHDLPDYMVGHENWFTSDGIAKRFQVFIHGKRYQSHNGMESSCYT